MQNELCQYERLRDLNLKRPNIKQATPALAVSDLSFSYDDDTGPVLSKVTFLLGKHSIVALVGASGAGKTTLLLLLAGVYSPNDPGVKVYAGQVLLGGVPPWKFTGPQNISMMFQRPALLPHLTAEANVSLPLRLTGRQDFRKRAFSILEDLGLGSDATKRPQQLSGGMKTRVALARALVSEPKYLFLDEPFTALDLVTKWRLYRYLLRERETIGSTTVLATHDLSEALLLADQILVVTKRPEGARIESVQNSPPSLEGVNIGACLDVVRPRLPLLLDALGEM
jgi:NitT/TauT family transport system ATP-binding protein